jgi:uncharacterized repeat protein (TIGR01451 family)
MSSRHGAIRRSVRGPRLTSFRHRALRAAVETLEPRQLLAHDLSIGTTSTFGVNFSGGVFTATNDNATISLTDLNAFLGTQNIAIDTGTGGSQAGSITWAPGLNLTYTGASRTLTLRTGSDSVSGGITINSEIGSTNALNVSLSAVGQVSVGAGISTGGGNITINAASIAVAPATTIDTVGGTVTFAPATPGGTMDIGLGTTPGAMEVTTSTVSAFIGALKFGTNTTGEILVTGPVQNAQDDPITVTSGTDIKLLTGGSLSTTHASITLSANQQATPSLANFNGIYLNGGQIVSTDGAVQLLGRGGGSGDGNAGVLIDSGGVVQTGGDVTVLGAGRAGNSSDGVDLLGGTVSSGGALTITGTAAPSNASNMGVYLTNGPANNSHVGSTGPGPINITGTAASSEVPAILFFVGSSLSAGGSNVILTGDVIELTDFHSFSTTGGSSITFQPLTLSRPIVVDPFSEVFGALVVRVKEFNAISPNPGAPAFASVIIGRDNGTGAVTTGNNLSLSTALRISSGGAGSGGINLTNTITATNLTLNTGGSIVTSTGGQAGGSLVQVVAGTGIGSAASPLLTRATSAMAAHTDTGGIFISNTGAATLRVGNINIATQGITDSGSGDIQLTNAGSITMDNGQPVSGHGNVTLQSVGATADITLSNNSGAATTSGTTTLLSGRNIALGANVVGFVNGTLNSSDASAVLNATGDITINNVSSVSAFGSGTISMTAGHNITMSHASGSGSRIASQSGEIQITTGAGGTFSMDTDNPRATITSTVAGTGANITIKADIVNLTSNDFITAGTGKVSIQQVTAGRLINLGSTTDVAANTLELSNAELNNILSASSISLGNGLAGSITVSNPVSLSQVSTLALITGGSVTGLSPLSVPSLSAVASQFIYIGPSSQIGTFAGVSSGASQPVELQNLPGVTIGTVGGISGITTNNSEVDLLINGNITIAANISAGLAPVNLVPAGGDVTQLAGTIISGNNITQSTGTAVSTYAGTVQLTAGGGFFLTGAKFVVSGNVVLNGGGFTMLNGIASTISGVISGNGNFNLKGIGGATLSNANTYTGATLVQAPLTVNGSIGSTGTVILTGATAVLSGTGSIAGSVSVNIQSSVAGKLTIAGAVSIFNGTFGGTGTVQGPMTITAGTVAPGSNVGVLNTADMTFSPGTRLNFDLGGNQVGTAATNHDLLNSTGNIDLGGTTLGLNVTFTPQLSDTFTLIQSTGNITGQFAQGDHVTFSGKIWLIAYSQHSVVLEQESDLAIGMTGPSALQAGMDAVYTITLTNNGPSDAVNVVWTDNLPAGESIVSVSNAQLETVQTASQLVISLPSMRAGNSQTYTLIAHVGSGVASGTSLVNTVSVVSPILDLVPGNNVSTVTTAVSTSADLSIAVSAPASGVEGSPITYSVTLTSTGPSDAQLVVFNAPLPAGSTFVSASEVSGPTCAMLMPAPGGTGAVSALFQTIVGATAAVFNITVLPTHLGTLSLTPMATSVGTPDPNAANNSLTQTISIIDAQIAVSAIGAVPSPIEGQSVTTALASVTDGNPFGTPADMTATIDWGDGSTSAGTVTQAGGAGHPMLVSGTHQYHQLGAYTAHVTVTDVGGSSGAADQQVVVLDAPLTAHAVTISPTRGVSFTGPVATFTDANPFATGFEYTTNINWGDGTVSDGLVQANGSGGYNVIGTHTYAAGGTVPVAVTIHDFGTGTVAMSTANVLLPGGNGAQIVVGASNPITGKDIAVVEGHAFNGSVATFTAPASAAGNLVAAINWGDGATSAGTVVNDGSGHFHVVGKHTYANPGQFAAKVAVGLKTNSARATAAFKATVADAPLVAGTARKLSATLNTALTAVLGSFTDTDPGNGTVSHYSGVIHWGDGSATSAAKFIYNTATHSWLVGGQHTFKSKGTFTVHIAVKDVTSTVNLVATILVG